MCIDALLKEHRSLCGFDASCIQHNVHHYRSLEPRLDFFIADPPDEISKGWIEFLPEVDLFCCEVTRAERG